MTSSSTMYQSTLCEEYAWSEAGQASMSIADAETYLACEPLSYQWVFEDNEDKYQVPAHIFEFMYHGAHPGVDVKVGGSIHVEIDACLLELEEMTKQQPVMGSSQQLPRKKVRFSSETKDVADEESDNGTRTEASSDADLHMCIMTARGAIGNEFWWAPDTQAGKLSDSEEEPLVPNDGVLIARRMMSQSLKPWSPEVDQIEALIEKLETRLVSQERAHQERTTYPALKFDATDGDRSRRLKSPASNRSLKRKGDEGLPPKRSRTRAPINTGDARTSGHSMQRDPITKGGKLWSPDEEPVRRGDNTESPRPSGSRSFETRSPEVDHTEVLIKQPETRPISQEQRISDVDKLHAVLAIFASKCTRIPSAPKKSHFSSGATDYIVEGSVDGVRIEASPDTGSDECIVSSHFASKLGKDPVSGTGKTITLANKKSVWSPGTIEVLWKFANDQTSHILKCWILPDSSKEFVLGSRFLKMTGTLTKFFHRVKKIVLPPKLRLRLMGEEKERAMGYFNHRMTPALADTGSDLMLVSSGYARRYGLTVHSGHGYCFAVELADGTTTYTTGVVRNATWSIGDSTVRCDFHVLEGLPADVILSKDYLFDLNVFSKHTESFVNVDMMEDVSLLCGIRLIDERLHDLEELEEGFLRDVTSKEAFDSMAVKKERVRRTLAIKKTAMLPIGERPDALRWEKDKKKRWDTARAQHKRLWNPSSWLSPNAIDQGAGSQGSG